MWTGANCSGHCQRALELNIDLESDLVAVAQFHVNASGQNRNKLHKALLEALSPDNPPTPNHRLLAQLPVTTYWTTNYDKLIESALRDQGKVIDVKSSVPQMASTRPNRDVTIFKMHGDIERPDEAVVTKDDYERYSKDREPFVTALSGDLVKKTFLFLGFSFTDPNLEHVLSRVRLNFSINQRQHYAIFRTRAKQPGEKDADFAHYGVRQTHVIEDLKRFNVKVLLIDEYSEVTDLLTELVNQYRRRTVFISTGASNYEPWGQAAVIDFAQELARILIADGTRIATGLGAGIGDAIFTGALREVMRNNLSIEDFSGPATVSSGRRPRSTGRSLGELPARDHVESGDCPVPFWKQRQRRHNSERRRPRERVRYCQGATCTGLADRSHRLCSESACRRRDR